MQREKIRVCVIRVGGTNRDGDIADCIEDQGVSVEILHLNDILRRRNLNTYNALVLPGGFAYGDYVRAGAIWGKRLQSFLKDDLKLFVESKKPILGVCNGFQALIEAGLLPSLNFVDPLQLALASNRSARFECRWVYVKKNPASTCIFTRQLKDVSRFPVAHGEGRFITASSEVLDKLVKNNQIALQYSNEAGSIALGKYPENPNGSVLDVAGICNPEGTVFGLMPHPEDAYWGYQLPDWTKERKTLEHGDGLGLFKSMIDYVEQTF